MTTTSTPLSELFVKTKSENRAALIGYLPAGFPTIDGAITVIQAMIEGGVDAVEIGFPYSDPVICLLYTSDAADE